MVTTKRFLTVVDPLTSRQFKISVKSQNDNIAMVKIGSLKKALAPQVGLPAEAYDIAVEGRRASADQFAPLNKLLEVVRVAFADIGSGGGGGGGGTTRASSSAPRFQNANKQASPTETGAAQMQPEQPQEDQSKNNEAPQEQEQQTPSKGRSNSENNNAVSTTTNNNKPQEETTIIYRSREAPKRIPTPRSHPPTVQNAAAPTTPKVAQQTTTSSTQGLPHKSPPTSIPKSVPRRTSRSLTLPVQRPPSSFAPGTASLNPAGAAATPQQQPQQHLSRQETTPAHTPPASKPRSRSSSIQGDANGISSSGKAIKTPPRSRASTVTSGQAKEDGTTADAAAPAPAATVHTPSSRSSSAQGPPRSRASSTTHSAHDARPAPPHSAPHEHVVEGATTTAAPQNGEEKLEVEQHAQQEEKQQPQEQKTQVTPTSGTPDRRNSDASDHVDPMLWSASRSSPGRSHRTFPLQQSQQQKGLETYGGTGVLPNVLHNQLCGTTGTEPQHRSHPRIFSPRENRSPPLPPPQQSKEETERRLDERMEGNVERITKEMLMAKCVELWDVRERLGDELQSLKDALRDDERQQQRQQQQQQSRGGSGARRENNSQERSESSMPSSAGHADPRQLTMSIPRRQSPSSGRYNNNQNNAGDGNTFNAADAGTSGIVSSHPQHNGYKQQHNSYNAGSSGGGGGTRGARGARTTTSGAAVSEEVAQAQHQLDVLQALLEQDTATWDAARVELREKWENTRELIIKEVEEENNDVLIALQKATTQMERQTQETESLRGKLAPSRATVAENKKAVGTASAHLDLVAEDCYELIRQHNPRDDAPDSQADAPSAASDEKDDEILRFIANTCAQKHLLRVRLDEALQRNTHSATKLEELVVTRRLLSKELEELRGNIRVVVRMRPVVEGDSTAPYHLLQAEEGAISIDKHSVHVRSATTGHRSYEYYGVYGPTNDSIKQQQDIFGDQVKPLLGELLDGVNVSVIAYGQTSSGKTFTIIGEPPNMTGVYSKHVPLTGLLPQSIAYLLNPTDPHPSMVKYLGLQQQQQQQEEEESGAVVSESPSRRLSQVQQLSISMTELYLDSVYDLLCDVRPDGTSGGGGATAGTRPRPFSSSAAAEEGAKKCDVRATGNGMIVVGAVRVEVRELNEAMGVIRSGIHARQTHKTLRNAFSSRSHLILTLEVRMRDGTSSQLVFADLAGSERVSKSLSQGERLKEAQHINKGLSALGDVMHALTAKSTTATTSSNNNPQQQQSGRHVPYRNSKLTQLLQNSLGGDAKTLLMTCICPHIPHQHNMGETECTLQFASRAKLVQNVVRYRQQQEREQQQQQQHEEQR